MRAKRVRVERLVSASELSTIRMAAGNERKYSVVVDDGYVKEWVGIGWITKRRATDADKRQHPTVVH